MRTFGRWCTVKYRHSRLLSAAGRTAASRLVHQRLAKVFDMHSYDAAGCVGVSAQPLAIHFVDASDQSAMALLKSHAPPRVSLDGCPIRRVRYLKRKLLVPAAQCACEIHWRFHTRLVPTRFQRCQQSVKRKQDIFQPDMTGKPS